MMMTLDLPANFARAPVTAQLRYLAKVLQVGKNTHAVAAVLDEAAVEIEMGQTTRLTYRGREMRR